MGEGGQDLGRESGRVTSPSGALRLLSGGAAKGLVEALAAAIADATGAGVDGTFGAVGAMRERLVAGDACDVVILTAALVAELTASGHLVEGSSAPLGGVQTGIAVRAGDPLPAIADGAALAAALCAARAIHYPDPVRATAGIHFDGVLNRLGIHATVAPRLRTWPSGTIAMRELARGVEPQAIGCTQVTEIVANGDVSLVGMLPPPYALATLYVAAVSTRAAEPGRAMRLVEFLTGGASASARSAAGFET
jgi:molybdate transport system substrate-binding protein